MRRIAVVIVAVVVVAAAVIALTRSSSSPSTGTGSRTGLAARPAKPEGSGVLTQVDRRYPQASPSQRTAPAVSPRIGSTSTIFTVKLTVRQRLGPHGSVRDSYRLLLAGPRPRCAVFTELTSATEGTRVGVKLNPPIELGWCRGTYRGAVLLETNPNCSPAPAGRRTRQCHLFATRYAEAGRFDFRTR